MSRGPLLRGVKDGSLSLEMGRSVYIYASRDGNILGWVRTREEQEENLHGQFQGTARIPHTQKGADAFKELMKEFLGILPYSGYKVPCKLLDITQPDEKMNAYEG